MIPTSCLPAVHRVVSRAKRWLLGTHQGAADSTHMSHYLNEFVFRFNRRRSRSRGMVFYRGLELAVAHEPMRFQDLIASRRPRKLPPEPPKRRGHPTSLERPGAKPAVAVGGRTLMGVATHSGLNGYPQNAIIVSRNKDLFAARRFFGRVFTRLHSPAAQRC